MGKEEGFFCHAGPDGGRSDNKSADFIFLHTCDGFRPIPQYLSYKIPSRYQNYNDITVQRTHSSGHIYEYKVGKDEWFSWHGCLGIMTSDNKSDFIFLNSRDGFRPILMLVVIENTEQGSKF